MTPQERCSKRVYDGTRADFGGHQCGKRATLEHEGKRYCALHYPPNVEAKRTEEQKRWEAERAKQRLQDDISRAEQAVVRAAEEWYESREGDKASEEGLILAVAVLVELKAKR